MTIQSALEHASKLLVLNAGSSSLKFKLFSIIGGTQLQPKLCGLVERIDEKGDNANLTVTHDEARVESRIEAKDHSTALKSVLDFMKASVSPNIDREVMGVGHRVVHGLDISMPSLLTPEVISKIEDAITLAPLHNPPGLHGINAARSVFPSVPQVAVFDTAYHTTMPAHAHVYPLPYEMYVKHRIRKYGFHGTSHKYLAGEAARMLGKRPEEFSGITCHLGNGSSVTAIQAGQSIDTSMGMTPLEGLMMGTRTGDVDAGAVLHIMQTMQLSVQDANTLLNKKSGLLGITGDNDLRTIIKKRDQGDARAMLAFDMFTYRIKKYVGSYLAALNGDVDAIVFSAGIGENSALVREHVLGGLKALGVEVDPIRNAAMTRGAQGEISSDDSKVKVLVVPTDEEMCIAAQTLEVITNGDR